MDKFYNEMFLSYFDKAFSWLPVSPLMSVDLSVFQPYLGYLNWVVPFGFMVDSFLVFLGAYAAFCAIKHLLSWFHVIP